MKKLSLIAGLCLGLFLLSSANGFAQATVSGQVVRRADGMPIPGLTVSLVHPVVGRSFPSGTDVRGVYFFSNVPFRPEPYFLEIYWGQQLIFRNTIMVTQPQIILPPVGL